MSGMMIITGAKAPKKSVKASMPPPEMPTSKAPAQESCSCGKCRAEETEEGESPASPIGEIAERYGMSEEDGKAFLREALEALLGSESGPSPEADTQYGETEAA